jgi:hypothetical protein
MRHRYSVALNSASGRPGDAWGSAEGRRTFEVGRGHLVGEIPFRDFSGGVSRG